MKIGSIILLVALIFNSCDTSVTTKQYISPDKNLAVEFTETVKPKFDYIVGATIKQNGVIILEEPNFAVREEDDGRHFNFVFFKTDWEGANVLRCTDSRSTVKDSEIEYTLINKAQSKIKYLWIGNYSEEFLVVGLDPEKSLAISSKVNGNSLDGIYVMRVLFDSGAKIDRKDMSYSHILGKTSITITINESSVEMQTNGSNQLRKS